MLESQGLETHATMGVSLGHSEIKRKKMDENKISILFVTSGSELSNILTILAIYFTKTLYFIILFILMT